MKIVHVLTSASVLVSGLVLAGQTTVAAPSHAQNLKALHTAVTLYASDYDETLPPMSSPANQVPRTRWADTVSPYAKNVEVFRNPAVPDEMHTRKFADMPNAKPWGGYGYNFQYLGNSRSVAGNKHLPFGRTLASISAPAKTILIAETMGVRKDDGSVAGGVYTVDPPRPSERGSGSPDGFYGKSPACGSGPMGCRSFPGEWTPGVVNFVTIDGKHEMMSRARIDDSDGDGTLDNGWFNGWGDAKRR